MIGEQQHVILGPPGTGKTTRLLNIMEQEMSNGVPPDRIAFVSFTKKAAEEAATRAMVRFDLLREQLPFFRTLHSLAFRQIQLSTNDVMGKAHWDEFADLMGVDFTGENTEGTRLLSIYDLHRGRMVGLKDAWQALNTVDSVPWFRLLHFVQSFEEYKADKLLWDFGDMISKYGDEATRVDVDVAIIDEAQDLSAAQWRMVEIAFSGVDKVFIAGDDDQAIHRWAGADVKRFLSLDGEREVLNKSYRLPQKIWEAANNVTAQIKNRYEKDWTHTGELGSVEWIHRFEEVDTDVADESWMFLTRNVYQLSSIQSYLTRRGVPFTHRGGSSIDPAHVDAILGWEHLLKKGKVSPDTAQNILDLLRPGKGFLGEPDVFRERGDYDMTLLIAAHNVVATGSWFDAFGNLHHTKTDYYRRCLQNGENLTAEPRIHLNTIHGVKGGEADNVVLCLDQSRRTHRFGTRSPDDEHRVFYVGATRARKRLLLKTPSTKTHYRMTK